MDDKLKQRLVGAAVIVALAAIFIPMILEGPDDGMGPVGSNLPPAPEYKVKDRVEPLVLPPPPETGAGTASEPAGVPDAPEAALPETGTLAEAEPAPSPAPAPAPEPAPKPAPAPAPESAPAPAPAPAPAQPAATPAPASGWVVQVASFSQQANAERLQERLQEQGYQAFVESASTGSGSTWRVRVGPVPERAAAEKLQGEIAKAFDLKGLVAEYP